MMAGPDDRHGGNARLLPLLLLMWMPLLADAAPPVELDEPVSRIHLAPYLSWWCDGSGEADLETARRQALQPLQEPEVTFGYRDDACWFRSRLVNPREEAVSSWILVDYGLLDEVDVWLVPDEGEAEHWSLGAARPFRERPVQVRFFLVPAHLPPDSQAELWLRVRTNSSMTVPLEISSHGDFLERYLNRDWVLGTLYGIGFGLFCYHLVLWLGARERTNRFYVLHVGSTLVYLASLQGILHRFWPQFLPWWDPLPFVAGYLSLLAACLFSRDFLQSRRHRPLDRLLLTVSVVLGLALVAQMVAPLHRVTSLQGVLAIATVTVLFVVGLWSWWRSQPQARIFVLAWSLFLAMVLLWALNAYGLISMVPALLAVHGLQVALVVQQVLLSFGLVRRLNLLKEEALERSAEAARVRAESLAKTEFLARMSHEIRTPMSAVMGLAELMRDTRLDATQRNYVETLHRAGENLLGVINDILDYSRISAGRLELSPTRFHLPTLLEDCLAIFQANAAEKGLTLRGEWPETLPDWVEADATRLRQILLNLLSNATKFTPEGEVRLSAWCNGFAGGWWLHVSVEDQGPGIDQAQLDRLFEPFHQLDSSTSRQYGGSGLGLTISRQLAELMGGELSADSTPGQGSCFRVRVPLVQASAPAGQEAEPTGSFAGVSVLLVEDNAVNQMVIRALLHKLEVKTMVAVSGEEALRLLEGDDRPDLVLMDCEMPGMDGYEATRRLRERERSRGLSRLPVIALTAHVMAEHRDRCLAAGMDDHLAKPLTLKQLVETLEYWTGRRA